MKKTLTISGYRRPDYFQRVLTALSFCSGISEYAVTAVLDPSEWTDQLAYIARIHGFAVHVNEQHLGCAAAIRQEVCRKGAPTIRNSNPSICVHLPIHTFQRLPLLLLLSLLLALRLPAL